MTVLIAGGGISGLTLALSLHQAGVACRVFESVAELKPLGVGINVLPHAVRELAELGLLDRLDQAGVRTKELSFFSKHGKPIWTEPRGLEAGYKWPQVSIHRGILHQILLDAVIERLGADSLRTSHHLADFTETADGVRARFIDKATGKPVMLEKRVTNVRNYTSPFWRSALVNPERRCLVPFTAFSEYGQVRGADGKLPLHWFNVPSRPIASFAGVWRPSEKGDVFAFLTCEPNPLVAAIHPKAMPVILNEDDESRWLTCSFDEAIALAQPYPSQLMAVTD